MKQKTDLTMQRRLQIRNAVLTLVFAGLGYISASLAIDAGSIWFYAGTLAALVLMVRSVVLALRPSLRR